MRSFFLSVGLILVPAACVTPGTGKPATPQRPTVSNDTSTTAEGTLELEAGAAIDPGDAGDLPFMLKYGLDHRTDLALGFSPLRWVDRPGDNEYGVGDLVIGARHRFHEETESEPAIAALVAAKVPTADDDKGLGTGEFDFGAAAIFSKTAGRMSYVAQAGLDFVGDPRGGTDLGQTFALVASTPVADRWTGFAELAGIFVPSQDISIGLLTVGAAWAPEPDLVFDAAVVAGLSSDAPDFLFLIGLTRNFGRASSPPVSAGARPGP